MVSGDEAGAIRNDQILIVDDEPANRLVLEGMLKKLHHQCHHAANGAEALEKLGDSIDLVLLDVNMPGITGFEVARRIRSAPACPDVPIIMVTALSSMQDRLAAVEAGANDFICKPVDFTELRIRVDSQLRVKHAQDAVKRHQRELESRVEQRTLALRQANEKLSMLATTDPLTGLSNHRCLVDALEAELARCEAQGAECGVLFIDLDHFKALNDSCGHTAGDLVLTEFAALLDTVIGPDGTCGRWGGEEFVCILPGKSETELKDRAERLRSTVANHSFMAGSGYHLTCSIGLALFPRDGTSRSTIAETADKAMYVAKALGRNQVRCAEDVTCGFEGLRGTFSSREELALAGLVDALVRLVSARDEYTGTHAADVSELAKQVGARMGLSEEDMHLTGLVGKLHDIGKVAIPDAVLQKEGALSPDEWQIMRQHPIIGAEVIGRVPSLRIIVPAIRAHHERWDGSGYPDGLSGDGIPLAARIVAVVDAYAAMTNDRPYRAARGSSEALAELIRNSGSQFCPASVSALAALLSDGQLRAA